MKSIAMITIASALLITAAAQSSIKIELGHTAPNFSLPGSDGKSYDLDSYRGKYVVLEWTNKDCPYVRKHYRSGNMQASQKAAIGMGAVWLSIVSSAPGQPGYLTADSAASYRKDNGVNSTATLLDPEGKVGHLYDARTSPQIVIVDPKGVVIYDGAMDDQPTPDPASVPIAKNYALTALKEAMSGKPVSTPTSRPYGCGIKYAD